MSPARRLAGPGTVRMTRFGRVPLIKVSVGGVLGPMQFALLEPRRRGGVIHSRQLRLILGFRCAFTETDQRLTFVVAPHAPRLGSHQVEAPAKPDSSHVIPVKRSRESESERLHRTGFCHVKKLRLHGTLARSSSLRRESFGFSAKQVHPFAFDPSRVASADSGVLLGLAALTIPRSLLLEVLSTAKDASDRFLPPNQLRTNAPVSLGSRTCVRGEWRFTTHPLASANHLAFEEGFSPCLAHMRLNL